MTRVEIETRAKALADDFRQDWLISKLVFDELMQLAPAELAAVVARATMNLSNLSVTDAAAFADVFVTAAK